MNDFGSPNSFDLIVNTTPGTGAEIQIKETKYLQAGFVSASSTNLESKLIEFVAFVNF